MDCKTPFDALAVKSSVAQKCIGANVPLAFFKVEVSFRFIRHRCFVPPIPAKPR
jgi:hypothetical protein